LSPSPGQRLAEGDADILDGVVGVDVQVAVGLNFEVDQAVPGNLLEHVIEKGDTGGEAALAAAIEVQANGDPGFECIPGNFCLPHRETIAGWQKNVGFEENLRASRAGTARVPPIGERRLDRQRRMIPFHASLASELSRLS
jgi:hypothetical protein